MLRRFVWSGARAGNEALPASCSMASLTGTSIPAGNLTWAPSSMYQAPYSVPPLQSAAVGVRVRVAFWLKLK